MSRCYLHRGFTVFGKDNRVNVTLAIVRVNSAPLAMPAVILRDPRSENMTSQVALTSYSLPSVSFTGQVKDVRLLGMMSRDLEVHFSCGPVLVTFLMLHKTPWPRQVCRRNSLFVLTVLED